MWIINNWLNYIAKGCFFMKSRVFILFITALFLLMTGCGKSVSNDAAKDDGEYDVVWVEEDVDDTADNQTVAKSSASKENEPQQEIKKIIKNGTMNLETKNVDKAYANILTYAEKNGGYEFSHEKTARDEFVSIKAVIKIKPEKLDSLISYAGSVADVINSSTNTDDITEKYYDAKLRLETKRKTLETYYQLLGNTKELNQILTIQAEINKITEDIEAYEGKLKMWDQLVSESSLTITIDQVDDPLKIKKEVNWSALSWSDAGIIIKNGFTTVSNIIVAVLQWTVIIVASISPLIVVVAVVFIILRIRKKKKQEKLFGSKKDSESEKS